MPLDDIAMEELGLAPRWVRKGARQAARRDGAGHESGHADTAGGSAQRVHANAGDEPVRARPAPVASAVPGGSAQPANRPGVAGSAGPAASSEAPRRTGPVAARATASPQGPGATASPAPTQVDAAPEARLPRAETDAQAAVPPPAAIAPAAIAVQASRDTAADRSTPALAASAADEPPPLTEDDFAWFDAVPTGSFVAPADEAAPAAPRDDVATLDWDALEARVASCTRCRLCEKRNNTVFGVGDREAEWMLIGEAPGENEDRLGEPFVGQAGKLLDNMLRALSLARGQNVYIANVIKCRPPGNRNPEPDEVARCEPYLQRQVALVKPKIIVAMGRFAAQSLLKSTGSIASMRGRVHEYEGVPVIVTYHPAYLLRSLHDKSKAWADLCLARDMWRAAAGGGR